jgi:pimeloyl-ACP methyl ester carboxylesterase
MSEHIMMIHGMWCGDWVWDNYKKFFESKGYRCITPTLRYHDNKYRQAPDNRIGTTSLLDYAEDLENEIYKLDQKPILMGHSMGGLIAQMLGSRGLSKALVLLTPASPKGIIALRFSVMKSFWSATTKPGFWRKPMLQTFDEAVYSMMQLLPNEEQKNVYERLVPESGRAAFEIGYWPLDRRSASKVDSAKITCPTLVIAGGHDKITPPSVVHKVADKYSAATTFKEFPDHAHWVIGEPGWKDVAEYSSDWLNQVLITMPQRPQPPTIRNIRTSDRVKKVVSEYKEKWFPVKQEDRRVHKRTEAVMEVEVNIPYSGNAQYYELGRAVNISRGGVYVNTSLPLDEGTYVNANLDISESERPMWVQGRIVRSSGTGMAMIFSHAESDKLNKLISA